MRIVIIGATGFVGQRICAAGKEVGHIIVGCGRKRQDEVSREALSFLDSYWSLRDGDIPGDLWDGADAVILLAARRPYPGFGLEDYHANVQLAADYMQQAEKHQVRRFVFASSKAAYSGGGMPWKESDYCVPSGLYGASKTAAEQLGMMWSSQGKFSFISLRLAQVIGAGEKKNNLVKAVLENAKAHKPQMIYGSGDQKRHYIYLKDAGEAFLAALSHPEIQGIFNIGMSCAVTNLELAEAANAAFGNEGNIEFLPDCSMRGADDEMNIDKAREQLGFKAGWDIHGAFDDIKKTMEGE